MLQSPLLEKCTCRNCTQSSNPMQQEKRIVKKTSLQCKILGFSLLRHWRGIKYFRPADLSKYASKRETVSVFAGL